MAQKIINKDRVIKTGAVLLRSQHLASWGQKSAFTVAAAHFCVPLFFWSARFRFFMRPMRAHNNEWQETIAREQVDLMTVIRLMITLTMKNNNKKRRNNIPNHFQHIVSPLIIFFIFQFFFLFFVFLVRSLLDK